MRGRSETLCQASLACFLIKRWQVVSGLFHDLDDLVERHTVVTIGERGVDIGVEGTAGSESVTLDTWYLHESADRVACHTEMMLQSHLRRIFYLRGASAEQLARRGRCHGACHADLSLTPDIGTRY